MRENVLRQEGNIALLHLDIAPGRGTYRIQVDGQPNAERCFEYFKEEEKDKKGQEARREFDRYMPAVQ